MERRCFFRFFALPPYFFGISSCYFFTFSVLFMRFALFAPGVQAAALLVKAVLLCLPIPRFMEEGSSLSITPKAVAMVFSERTTMPSGFVDEVLARVGESGYGLYFFIHFLHKDSESFI